MRCVFFLLCLSLSALAEQRYFSPSDIETSQDGTVLYLACATDDSILLFDTAKEKVVSRFTAAGVRDIALSHDGARLYAACGEFAGRLLEIDAKTGKTLRSFWAQRSRACCSVVGSITGADTPGGMVDPESLHWPQHE